MHSLFKYLEIIPHIFKIQEEYENSLKLRTIQGQHFYLFYSSTDCKKLYQ